MQYKLVVTDFDDTLLRSDLTISDYSKQVIAAYEEKGGTFTISTGRMLSSILPNIKRASLKGLVISYNGAMISDIESGKVLYSKPIAVKDALLQIELLEQEQAITHLYYNDTLYVEKHTPQTSDYERVCEIKANVLGYKLSRFVAEKNVSPEKILAIMEPKKVQERLLKFKAEYGDVLDFSMSKPYFFEIMAKGVNKGTALKMLCNMKGVTTENVMAFGDSLNDIQMLETAGLSFAVENAQQLTKLAAKMTCPSNNDDGVAKTIEKYCLNI